MKYAKREFERRFLLKGVPRSLPTRYSRIVDAYFEGTTLRLRHVVESDGSGCVYKLTQKKIDSGGQTWMTSIYLSEAEAALLRSLPTVMLKKHRYRLERGGIRQAIDIVEGLSDKIVLLEIEGESAAEIREPPSGFDIVREVTSDERFSGYAIALRIARKGDAQPLSPANGG